MSRIHGRFFVLVQALYHLIPTMSPAKTTSFFTLGPKIIYISIDIIRFNQFITAFMYDYNKPIFLPTLGVMFNT